MKQCPVCHSWMTHRIVQGVNVWFQCGRCGHTFA